MGKNILWLWINEHQLSKARTVMFELVSLEHLHLHKNNNSTVHIEVGCMESWVL